MIICLVTIVTDKCLISTKHDCFFSVIENQMSELLFRIHLLKQKLMKFNLKEQTCTGTFHFLAKGSEWYMHDSFLCVKYSKVCLVRILGLIFFFHLVFSFFFFSYFDVITFQRPQQNSYHLCSKQKYPICLQHQTKKYCKIKGKK